MWLLRIQHIAAAAWIVCAGCAVRPAVWHVEGRTLYPPGRGRPIVVKTRGVCAAGDAIAVRRSRGRAQLTVNGEALARKEGGWLAVWSAEAETNGCVAQGDGLALADRVLESAPLGIGMPYRLMHPEQGRSGYVDLGPENRLEVVTPVGADEAAAEIVAVEGSDRSLIVTAKGQPGFLGVERTWYAVRRDGIVPMEKPRRNLFEKIGPGYYRLVYKADQSSVVLAAGSRAELVRADADACGAGPVRCMPVPRFIAVNPYLAEMVNGKEARVPVGSTVRTAVRAGGGHPQDALKTLRIERRFAGRMTPVQFDRTKPDVLDLVLLGNETVRW
jgi:hypothetical protein